MRKQGCLYKIFPAAMLKTATRIALYAFIALALRSSVTAAKKGFPISPAPAATDDDANFLPWP